jgi:MSHA pilin protein MshD
MSIDSRVRGFSLVEIIVFIMIVSVALAGVLGVMNFTTAHSADPLVRKQAIAVAESLLEEIKLQSFNNPAGGYSCGGTCTQADRASLDDVSDYHGFATSGVYPVNSSVVIPGLASYNTSVTVVASPAPNPLSGVPAADVKLITVTVTGPDNTTVTLAAYRANLE